MADLKFFESREAATAAIERLSTSVSLSTEQLSSVNSWLREHTGDVFEFDPDVIERGAQQLAVSLDILTAAVSTARRILPKVSANSAAVEDFISDLATLGVPEEDVRKAGLLLRDLSLDPRTVEAVVKKFTTSQLGIPTFQNLDVFFDLRPVFAEAAAPFSTPEHRAALIAISGLVPVAILNIQIEDEAGSRQSFVAQLTPAEYRGMMKVLEEGLVQLEAIKQRFGDLLV
jgi:hypothetical protein